MSHGKETPRQKMINLMYLVLTCLLALNVSKDVLLGFVTINESIEATNSNFKSNTAKLMEAVEEAIKQGHHEVKPYYLKAKEVTALTQKTYTYIDSLKKQVIKYTEDVDNADTLTLAQVERLDDYDKPTYLLIGSDETKPRIGNYSASELRQTMIVLADSMTHLLDEMKNKDGLRLPEDDYLVLKDRINLFKPGNDYKDLEGNTISWEIKNFYNLPLAAVITNLSKIQSDIRNIEGEMVNVFASAAGKLSVKFNRMEARIVPVSQYVQAGTPYTADVFLSASSTDFKEDNLQFILGDVDTSTGTLGPGAKYIPVDMGTGKIILPTNDIGRKEINGWIKFREGTGIYKYFKYNNAYTVANAAVAVSPDKMNVFYAGVENPLTVSAAGIAPQDVALKIEGCDGKFKELGNGKFNVTVKGQGSCTVYVFQKSAEGLKKQGTPQVFRVKKFPSPPLRLSGRNVIGNLDMSLPDAKNIGSLGLDLTNMDFNAPFQIKSFSITMGGVGAVQFFKCDGNKLSDEAKAALQRIKRGTKIYFEDIKVQAPDEIREMPMVKVTVR